MVPQVRSALGRNRLSELGEQLATAKPDAPATPSACPAPTNDSHHGGTDHRSPRGATA